MTVPSETSEIDYTGDNSAVAFPIPFPWQEDSQIVVTYLLSGGTVATTLVDGVGYNLTGAGDPTGTCTTTFTPATGSTLHIERTVPITQETNLRTQGNFSPLTHEELLDYRTYVDQMLERRIDELEALAALVQPTTYDAIQVTKQFTTSADIQDTFPFNIALPAGFTATGVKVVRAQNVTDSAAKFHEAVAIPAFTQSGANLVVPFVTGLFASTEYLLTLEVTDA